MFEVLHDAIMSGDYDYSMVYGDIIPLEDLDRLEDAERQDNPSRVILSQDVYWKRLIDFGASTCQFNVVWNKLYKRSLQNDP